MLQLFVQFLVRRSGTRRPEATGPSQQVGLLGHSPRVIAPALPLVWKSTKGMFFLLQLLDDWINIDSAICMESSDVNCKILWILPFFFFSLSSAYLTSYGRLHSPACDAAPPWDPDLSWPAWCAAFAWIGCPKSRVKKKQVAKICIDFGQ